MRSLLLVTAVAWATAAFSQVGMEKTAMQIAGEMVPGWNLGNTMEATNNAWNYTNQGGLGTETYWQQTKTSQAVIDYVKAQGFRSVRIPCAWVAGHIADKKTMKIDEAWMARVKEVVDYCIHAGLYVVLNDHWDGGWLENNISDTDANGIAEKKSTLHRIWTQIAETFKDYDEHLLFAGLNEPNVDDGDGRNAILGRQQTNRLVEYEQVFIDAVRATGGNNAQRVLVIQGPSTDIDKTVKYMTDLPTDPATDRLAIEVHYYNPWQFWGMTKDENWGKMFYYWGSGNHHTGSQHNATWGEESTMRDQLQKMKTNFVDKGYPIIIGEFGANWRDLSKQSGENQEKHNASIKAHYRELHRLCKEFGGMVPYIWDINDVNQHGTQGTMTVINRRDLSIYNPYAMEGIQEIYPATTNTGVRGIKWNADRSAVFYSLQGVRVGTDLLRLPRGIYAKGGKKVIVR